MNIFKKVLLVALSAGLLSVPSTIDKVEAAETRTIYLNAGGSSLWDQGGAWFAARVWNEDESEFWYIMQDNDGDGVYEADIDTTTYPNVIFVRKDPASSTLDWNNVWNQTYDLTFESNNCFTITGWVSNTNKSNGTWSNYTPDVQVTGDENYGLVGAFKDANWDVFNEGYRLVHNSEKGRYEYTKYLEKDTEFKVSKDFNWDVSYGYDNATDSAKKYLSGVSGDNMKAKYTGTYTIYILDEDHRTDGIKVDIEFNSHLQTYLQYGSEDHTTIRLIGTFGDATDTSKYLVDSYYEVGFKVTFNEKTKELIAGYIYESVEGNGVAISANTYGAQYFFCLTFNGVDVGTTFEVTPFAILSDKVTYNYGATVSITTGAQA